MRGELKRLLDGIAKSERETIALLGTQSRDEAQARKLAAAERWEWITRHSTTTAFPAATQADVIMGRDA